MAEADPHPPDANNKPAQPENNTANKDEKVEKEENIVGKGTIKVKNLSKIKEKRHYTDDFELCGMKWYVKCITLS